MDMHPKFLGLTLDPKLTYSTHMHNISVHAHKPLQIKKHPAGVMELLARKRDKLAGGPTAGRSDSLKQGSRKWVDTTTNIPGTIIKFIKGRKAYTTYRNQTSI